MEALLWQLPSCKVSFVKCSATVLARSLIGYQVQLRVTKSINACIMFAALLNVNRSFISVVVCRFGLPPQIQTQTWGKPAYTAQAPDEQLEPSQELNETEILNRGKRQVTFTLANVCPAIITSTGSSNSPSNGHPCVKRWYFCPKYNLYEAECHSSAWSCQSSITRHGYMKCTPIIKTVIINKGTNNEKHVRLNKTCTCA